jgi:glutamate-1-semialdehyde aminotransferase
MTRGCSRARRIAQAWGGGLPFGACGMTAKPAAAFERDESLDGAPGELATGGTLFGNALSMAAADEDVVLCPRESFAC